MQRVSAAFVAFSHGSNDAQKTMGVITAALISYEAATTATAQSFAVPTWVIALSATAMAPGNQLRRLAHHPHDGHAHREVASGGWLRGETAAASVIIAASHVGLPVSTTHVIAGSVMGVGARQRLSAVRWGVAGNMVIAWILTGPITAIIAAMIFFCFVLPRDGRSFQQACATAGLAPAEWPLCASRHHVRLERTSRNVPRIGAR